MNKKNVIIDIYICLEINAISNYRFSDKWLFKITSIEIIMTYISFVNIKSFDNPFL